MHNRVIIENILYLAILFDNHEFNYVVEGQIFYFSVHGREALRNSSNPPKANDILNCVIIIPCGSDFLKLGAGLGIQDKIAA